MDNRIRAQVEGILKNASIASVRSWLKGKGKKFSAGTRDRMVDRITKLIEKSEITFADLQDGIVGIEEASGKIISVLDYKESVTSAQVKQTIEKAGLPIKESRVLAKLAPLKPTAAYAQINGDNVRIKWSETHKKPRMDFETDKIVYDEVSKVVVLVANLKTKEAEIRYDKPETFHPHSRMAGSKNAYFDFYLKLAENVLGVTLQRTELQATLKGLIENSPSLVRLHKGGHTNKQNNYFSGTARETGTDIRDDDEYQAMLAKSGGTWAYEDQSFRWRPDRSKGALTREVFSHVDVAASTIRMDADCWDGEVEYAVKKIRGYK